MTIIVEFQLYARKVIVSPTGCFKRAMCISCRRHVDVHKRVWTHVDREGVKNRIFLWTSKMDDSLMLLNHKLQSEVKRWVANKSDSTVFFKIAQ